MMPLPRRGSTRRAVERKFGYNFLMNRRHVIGLLGCAFASWPLAARAQQPMPGIGLLAPESHDRRTPRFRAFHQGLGEAGFAEGRNVAVEYR